MAEIHPEKGVPVFLNVQQLFFCVSQTKSYATILREFLMIVFLRDIYYSHGKKSTFQNNIQKSHLFTIASLPFYI